MLGKRSTVDWRAWSENYDLIRDGVAKVIPGFENYNERVRVPGGFYLPNPPRHNQYHTDTGKAKFTINPIPQHRLEPAQLLMTTVRSHDQFNTTIYGLHDRYRGLHYERRIIMMHHDDIIERGLMPLQRVEITSHFEGEMRTLTDYIVVEYPIPRQCAAMYYPEANYLVPINSTEPRSNCPTFKSTVITVKPADSSNSRDD